MSSYRSPNKKIDIKELAVELSKLLKNQLSSSNITNNDIDLEPDFNTNEQIAKIMVSEQSNKKMKSNLPKHKMIGTIENKVDNKTINNIIKTIKDIT